MNSVRAASAQDVELWRALRRDGIARYPGAFIATLEEQDAIPPEVDAKRLDAGGRFLAFAGDHAVGLAGLNRNSIPRASHRAEVGPFYVIPDAQGTGAARALMQALLDHASAKNIWQIELFVNEENNRAIAFYKSFGFEQTGRVPNAILGAQGPENDLVMVLTLPHETVTPLPVDQG